MRLARVRHKGGKGRAGQGIDEEPVAVQSDQKHSR